MSDYFGLSRPALIAESFKPEVLSLLGSFVFNANFNVPICDEFYFTKVENKENIYFTKRDKGKWIQPEPINSVYEEFFFSISNSGNAYFASDRPGGFGSFDIYQTQIMKDGKMSEPINLGEPINSMYYEYDPYISLDENYMILSNGGQLKWISVEVLETLKPGK